MSGKIIVLLGALLLAAPTVLGETLVLPLDAVTGWEYWEEQLLDFDAGGQLLGLSRVAVHLTGECGDQMYVYCMDFYPWQALPASIGLSLLGEAGGPVLASLDHEFPEGPPVAVDLEWTFPVDDPVELESIADGTGRIMLTDLAEMFFSDTAGGFVCPVDIPCAVESLAVVLEFETLVGTRTGTWDAVKALYR